MVEPLERARPRLAEPQVLQALGLSLIFHLSLFTVIEGGHQLGLWKKSLLPEFLQTSKKPEPKQTQEKEIDLTFVDVAPSQAAAEPPKDPKFYASRNSVAANPEPKIELESPKIEGVQDKVFQALDKGEPLSTPLEPIKPQPLVQEKPPAPPEEKTEPKPIAPAPQPKPAPQPAPGDLALAQPPKPAPPEVTAREKPAPVPQKPPPPSRPRTLAAARAQKGIRGEKMKQEGGVRRLDLQPAFDAKATLFGAYDEKIVAAIRDRWYDLIEDYQSKGGSVHNRSGKVVVEFRLHSDGSVTEMGVSENEVTEVLGWICRRAIQDPAPYDRWPSDMRRLVGGDFRMVRFTFYYN